MDYANPKLGKSTWRACYHVSGKRKICRQALSIIIEDLKLQKIFHTLEKVLTIFRRLQKQPPLLFPYLIYLHIIRHRNTVIPVQIHLHRSIYRLQEALFVNTYQHKITDYCLFYVLRTSSLAALYQHLLYFLY